MKNPANINCPQCNFEINVNDILYHKLDEELKKKYALESNQEKQKYEHEMIKIEEAKISLQKQQEEMNASIAKATRELLQAEKSKLETKLREQISFEHSAVVDTKSIDPHILRRNEHVEKYQNKGIYAWANKNSYWDRNRAKTTMGRFKTTFSGTLASRKVESQQNEIILKCEILNKFASITMPLQDSAA